MILLWMNFRNSSLNEFIHHSSINLVIIYINEKIDRCGITVAW